ncbi:MULTISPECIES: sodium:proton antiporter [unclassified Nocardiopsis]|uniref:sodium:proton antiporter n=1 Tax=unclassified Nocardiopsis TaxID=2649073 RepID=UPI001359CC30|nr:MULTISPECIES: NADH-quinone oxidoreductase subunit K [unclassified Nocardiopsis]
MTLSLAIGVLTAAAVYLVLQRGMVRIVLGLVLLGNAVNLLLVSAGGAFRRDRPLLTEAPERAADPLPQAFVLTAIVITFSITVYMLTLAGAGEDDDDTEDGP